jgi:hypothetical protein
MPNSSQSWFTLYIVRIPTRVSTRGVAYWNITDSYLVVLLKALTQETCILN